MKATAQQAQSAAAGNPSAQACSTWAYSAEDSHRKDKWVNSSAGDQPDGSCTAPEVSLASRCSFWINLIFYSVGFGCAASQSPPSLPADSFA
ncbi:hypothetical protein cyc_03921 [Cyclospora cayetanensis]|uniref:Uncharacterized protein n=1 Tax=Cyclospora cayetanensis TaxID=88456 RepID=A0A1D3CVW6_9EIME|nr:hypothetical protein cyc_03921 [Cyclospora cayetanensis]